MELELPVAVVVGDRGQLGYVRLAVASGSGAGKVIPGPGLHDDAVVQQILRAHELAGQFMDRPWVHPLVQLPWSRSDVEVTYNGMGDPTGPSMGLAMLGGFLALGLGTAMQPRRVVSAALSEEDGEVLSVRLDPVGLVWQKALGIDPVETEIFLVRTEDEQSLLRVERELHERGFVGDQRAYLSVLPECVTVTSILAALVDTDQLLDRARKAGMEAIWTLALLHGMAGLHFGSAFVHDIGIKVAKLRQDQKLGSAEQLNSLCQDLGLLKSESFEQVISVLVPCALQKCPEPDQQRQILKAAISDDPDRSFAIEPESDPSDVDDLETWITRPWSPDPATLNYAVLILERAQRITPDLQHVWNAGRSTLLAAFLMMLKDATQRFRQTQAMDWLVPQLLNARLVSRMIMLWPDHRTEVARLVIQLANALATVDEQNAQACAQRLFAELSIHDLETILRIVEEQRIERLKIAFQHCPQSPDDEGDGLLRYNDLDCSYRIGEGTVINVPSPVLLVEDSARQVHPFSRRRGFKLGDSTMSAFEQTDVDQIWNLWESEIPVEISFDLSSGKQASVAWSSSINLWPPAIDTQFLVSTMDCIQPRSTPRSVLDVGCGTGYIGIVAAYAWSGVERLHLLDIDPAGVNAARYNIERASLSNDLSVSYHFIDFAEYTGPEVDVLLCNPPYLPERPLPTDGIELATNGTRLLCDVVRRGASIADEIRMVFSTIAWTDFLNALQSCDGYDRVEVLRRDFVPFRIGWLEPRPPDESEPESRARDERQYRSNWGYYEQILIPRGLIDLDEPQALTAHMNLHGLTGRDTDIIDCVGDETTHTILERLISHSRGFRFWQEVRVVRLLARHS